MIDEKKRASIPNSKTGQPQLNNNLPPLRLSGIGCYHQFEPQEADDMELSYKAHSPGFVQEPYINPPEEITHAGGKIFDPWDLMETDSSRESPPLIRGAPQLPLSVQNSIANFERSESESDATTDPDDNIEPYQPCHNPKKRNCYVIGDIGQAQ